LPKIIQIWRRGHFGCFPNPQNLLQLRKRVFEFKCRDGPARILNWMPAETAVTTPTLVIPETTHFAVPDWAQVVLTRKPTGKRVELVSDGTWFHQDEEVHSNPLVIKSPEPAPTSMVQVIDVGEDVSVWHDAGAWCSRPNRTIDAFIDAKKQARSRVFYAPMMGLPRDYALWVYLGVDLFDAAPLLLAATKGKALTPDGEYTVAQMQDMIPGEWTVDDLMKFNVEEARKELARVHTAIKAGSLRDLAERRAYGHPDSVAILRRFDREYHYLESHTPVSGNEISCMTPEAVNMPSVERFRRRLQNQYLPPASADILVLLPCSARKPYKISKSHRYFQRSLDDSGVRHRVHEVMITSPLGIVPRDLEDCYPANKYDVPVTGHWTQDEEAVIKEQLAHLLLRHEYKHVIAHVPESTYLFLRDILPDNTLHTAHHRPSGIEDCARLKEAVAALKDKTRPATPQAYKARKKEDLGALLTYQLGEEGKSLTDKCQAVGNSPFVKLIAPTGNQVGMTTIDRGHMSFSLETGDKLNAMGFKQVTIGDFEIKKTGSLFATGISGADHSIRRGDEVVIVRDNAVKAVGVAEMNATDMIHMTRGVGVRLRHITKVDA
jgi:archaeosine synthase